MWHSPRRPGHYSALTPAAPANIRLVEDRITLPNGQGIFALKSAGSDNDPFLTSADLDEIRSSSQTGSRTVRKEYPVPVTELNQMGIFLLTKKLSKKTGLPRTALRSMTWMISVMPQAPPLPAKNPKNLHQHGPPSQRGML
jgi:hypothetical protein